MIAFQLKAQWASDDPEETRVSYKFIENSNLVPYSSDIYPAVINLTFMGGASAAHDLEQCFSFPDSAFPKVAPAHVRARDRGTRPREIPLPMVIYVTMAVSISFALPDRGLTLNVRYISL